MITSEKLTFFVPFRLAVDVNECIKVVELSVSLLVRTWDTNQPSSTRSMSITLPGRSFSILLGERNTGPEKIQGMKRESKTRKIYK